MPMAIVPDPSALSASLDEALPRVIAIARGGGDPVSPVPGLNWTAAEVGTHLTMALLSFANAIQGTPMDLGFGEAEPDQTMPEYLSGINDQVLEMIGPKTLEDVAQGLESAHEALKVAFATQPDLEASTPTPWYGPGETRTIGTLMSLAVSETLVHGWDLTGALGVDRSFPEQNATPALGTVMSQMLPGLVKKDIPASVSVAYEMRVVGGESFVLRIDNGKSWSEPAGGPVDCVLTMRPGVGLLLAFRRVPVWKSVIGGHSRAAGRKPWLAFKFQNYFDYA